MLGFITVVDSVNQQPRERKIFDLFKARIVQKLYREMAHFHIVCVVCFGLYRSSRTVQAKQNVPTFSAGVSIESRVTTLIEAARTPPSFTRRRTKVDICRVQVPFYINGHKFGLNLPWLERAGS